MLDTIHTNVFCPVAKFVIEVLYWVGFAIVLLPKICSHEPFPEFGIEAANFVESLLMQIF